MVRGSVVGERARGGVESAQALLASLVEQHVEAGVGCIADGSGAEAGEEAFGTFGA